MEDNHFQTHEVIMSRVYCVCQALGINLGIIDLHKEEFIKESFNYNEGDYGFAVPYYVYVKDSTAVHLEQKLYQTADLAKTLMKAQKGEGHVVEGRKGLVN